MIGVPAVGGLKFSMAQKKVQKSASWGTKINPWTADFFPNFVGGKNVFPFQPLMILNKIHENIKNRSFKVM